MMCTMATAIETWMNSHIVAESARTMAAWININRPID